MTAYVMRASRLEDFDALMKLADLSGAGFTSLPVDEGRLREKLANSRKAFGGDLDPSEYGRYLMMMEDAETGEVVGCSAVKAGVGVSEPFFNYRIITVAQASQAADRRFDMDALVLTNEFVGYTEVGTLFLKKEHRGGGAGRLAAQSRYLLMAAAPECFGEMVLAELRGVVSSDGVSPFWECLGRHFFRMSFQDADYLSAVSDNQFILDLMPKYPIYVDLLETEAREAIGRCHADGVGALKLLEWEGFRFERVVDIFDGGPMVSTARDRIRTIRESRLVKLQRGEVAEPVRGLAATTELGAFRATLIEGEPRGADEVIVDAAVIDRLKLNPGDTARIWMKS
ncbi:MAG: arginine N-succinyltransferase [Pseudomonadota bacterium]